MKKTTQLIHRIKNAGRDDLAFLEEPDRSCFDTEEKMVDTALELTFEVSRLHHHRPQVIHRDIKPENVILRPTGSKDLIDFETVRNYKAGKESDTCCLGTRQTAAPEQFGFGQSDERTDVYGIGKTLLYLWTGDYELEGLKALHPHSRQWIRLTPGNCRIIREDL